MESQDSRHTGIPIGINRLSFHAIFHILHDIRQGDIWNGIFTRSREGTRDAYVLTKFFAIMDSRYLTA